MKRLRKLIDDVRGAGILAPVFIILSVVIMATLAVALYTAVSVSERSAATAEMGSTTRSAIAAFAAELNTTPVSQITARLTAEGYGYVPSSWIPSDTDRVRYRSLTSTADGYAVTFTVDSQHVTTKNRTFTVEFVQVPMVWADGRWVEAAEGVTPERLVWTGVRTIPGGTP